MRITADFERAVRAEALAYDRPKEGPADGWNPSAWRSGRW